jgi:hypothetical protein
MSFGSQENIELPTLSIRSPSAILSDANAKQIEDEGKVVISRVTSIGEKITEHEAKVLGNYPCYMFGLPVSPV